MYGFTNVYSCLSAYYFNVRDVPASILTLQNRCLKDNLWPTIFDQNRIESSQNPRMRLFKGYTFYKDHLCVLCVKVEQNLSRTSLKKWKFVYLGTSR